MKAAFVVERPGRHGRRALLALLARSFLNNPMNVQIHGEEATRRLRANRAGLSNLVLDTGKGIHHRVVLAPVEGRFEIVGGFVAFAPGIFPVRRPLGRRILGCIRHQGWKALGKWFSVNQDLLLLHPVETHWYLAVLGVDPESWGRGAGCALMNALDALVASNPAPVYLESDRPASVDFYLTRGFEKRTEIEIHGVRCACLGRGFDSI